MGFGNFTLGFLEYIRGRGARTKSCVRMTRELDGAGGKDETGLVQAPHPQKKNIQRKAREKRKPKKRKIIKTKKKSPRRPAMDRLRAQDRAPRAIFVIYIILYYYNIFLLMDFR